MDKAPWLALRDVEAEWPAHGKLRRVGVDNGAEFHSEAFKRGCEQHGIAIDWRPPGPPQFGGVVERVIGTLMGLVHGLPGTTFSNVGQRGSYDSDKAACLILEELERWLAVAVAKYYHFRPHEGLDGRAGAYGVGYDTFLRNALGRTSPGARSLETITEAQLAMLAAGTGIAVEQLRGMNTTAMMERLTARIASWMLTKEGRGSLAQIRTTVRLMTDRPPDHHTSTADKLCGA